MSGVRIAVALLLAAAGGVAVLLATTAGAAPGKRFHYTHRFAVTGQFVDHWTINDPRDCGPVGDGTVTLKFRMASAPKVRLVIDPVKNGEPNNTLGSWVLGVPAGGGIGDIKGQPATGTVTLVDNTSLRPPPPGGQCAPPDRSDCRTAPLVGAMSEVGGYNRRQLVANLLSEFGRKRSGRPIGCGIGQVTNFSDGQRLTGGTRAGELLLTMPSSLTVAHWRVLHVTGKGHKHNVFKDCGSGTTCSDDVTRSVTVTFKRL